MKIKVLDCTLRDGGYYNNWDFDSVLVSDYLEAMVALKVDFVEIGLRSLNNSSFKGGFAYSTDKFLNSLSIPAELEGKIGVMVNASELVPGDSNTSSYDFQVSVLEQLFTPKSQSPVTLVRIACHIHEFAAALPAATWLKEQGYKVGFNLMQIADRSDSDIISLAKLASNYPVDVLYFADSMGSLNPGQTEQIINWLRREWEGSIGVHTHDNLGLALSNTLQALESGCTWVDATVTGMGRGPGNAKTEELAIALDEQRQKGVDLVPLMALIRKHFKPMQQAYGWGTNPYYYLAGKYGIHPTYIQEMLSDSRYDEEDLLAVIDHLRVEGGKKFNFNTLAAARHFYKGEPQGKWQPKARFSGRDVLLLGAGPGVQHHRAALEAYIRQHQPLVVALNTQSGIASDLIDLRVACHPVRLLADCGAHTQLPQPLITPYSMLPDDVKASLANKEVLDFGLKVVPESFGFEDSWCESPTSLVVAYALAVATSGNAKQVIMTGFDGYGADDPRSKEMQHLFDVYQQTEAALPLLSITPTRYNLPTQSVYAL